MTTVVAAGVADKLARSNRSIYADDLFEVARDLNYVIEQAGQAGFRIPPMQPIQNGDIDSLVPQIKARAKTLSRIMRDRKRWPAGMPNAGRPDPS